MNSQIFPSNPTIGSGQIERIAWHSKHSAAVQWMSAILLIASIILFPERPAWGGDVEIAASPAGIRAVAHQAKLGEVLEVLADETGYTVYLDRTLADTAVSFFIQDAIPAERALQIILQPNSYALVYTRTSDPFRLQIDQIKVYYSDPNAPASPAPDILGEAPREEDESTDLEFLAEPVAFDE